MPETLNLLHVLLRETPGIMLRVQRANVAELADALDLGSSGLTAMGVRPSPFAPESKIHFGVVSMFEKCYAREDSNL